MYEHNSFVLYKDSRIFIDKLNKEQRGDLLAAIFAYVCDGTIPDFQGDCMLQMCFEIIKSYLDRDEKKYQEKCRKNKENINKRWAKIGKQSNTDVYDDKQSNTNYTDKDTDTDSVSVTDTDTDTVNETDTDQADAVFADRRAGSASADAEPPAGDLFSMGQLKIIAEKNKVNLTEEGIQAFHEEMQKSDWILFQKPVRKKGIVKALRGWTKYHPEYWWDAKGKTDRNNAYFDRLPRYLRNFKSWLRYHGYEYDGNGDFSEEVYVDDELIDIVFEVDDIDEPMCDINNRLIKEGFSTQDIEPLIKLFYKWMKEKEENKVN